MNQLVQKFVLTVDGKDLVFDTRAEAQDYLRRPKIKAALANVTGGNAELSDWLIAHQEKVEAAFESGTIRRVTKSEHNKLAKALEELKEKLPKNFVSENAGAVLDSFRWPAVKRMSEEEKATLAKNTLVVTAEGNAELADWIIAHKDAILEAYQAGVEKRQVNPKAAEALAAYRAKKAAEKAESEKEAA